MPIFILPGFMIAFFCFVASFAFEGTGRWVLRLIALGTLVLPVLLFLWTLATTPST
jgi:hypothetical protein